MKAISGLELVVSGAVGAGVFFGGVNFIAGL
jgi:hypothetical protein